MMSRRMISIRLPSDLLTTARQVAQRERRTLSNLIEYVLAEYIRRAHGAERGDPSMTTKTIEWTRTTYREAVGAIDHEAIQVTWAEIERLLGHPHTGDAEEDRQIVEALLASGAPAWVAEAEGWVDEHGWGLIRATHGVSGSSEP